MLNRDNPSSLGGGLFAWRSSAHGQFLHTGLTSLRPICHQEANENDAWPFVPAAGLPCQGHEAPILLAQLDDTRPTSATASVAGNKVTITVSGGQRVLAANGLPAHAPGQFPNRGNPNEISAQNYTFHIQARPQTNATARGLG